MTAPRVSRRRSLQWLVGAAAGSASITTPAVAAERSDPFDGASLYKLVQDYDALGEHRAATRADSATTAWLSMKLKAAGLAVAHQSFPVPLYEPKVCRVDLGGAAIETFPAWPPVMTPPEGVRAPLATPDAVSSEGKIAVVPLANRPGGSWAIPGYGDAVRAVIARGARGVIAVTDGPTGEIIALNIGPDQPAWQAPVVIAAGRDLERLRAAAASGAPVTLVSRGDLDPNARAENVIGRRNGRGKTVVLTTPKSGWFRCAGERGSGIALFVAAARWLVRETSCDLLFAASSGHELDYLGSDYFFKAHAPHPDDVRLWLHIGANASMQAMAAGPDGVKPLGGPSAGRLTASEGLLPIAARAFAGQTGYEHPIAFTAQTAVGELVVFQRGGYRNVVGMLGASPLFHTRLDRAPLATTPAVLESTARAMGDLLRGVVASA